VFPMSTEPQNLPNRHNSQKSTGPPEIHLLSSVFCILSSAPLYICRGFSTNQLLFMQNKPNFRKSQMNVNTYNTTDYENKCNWTLGQNKPNSNPIKPNLRKAQMNVNLYVIEDYRKKDDFLVRINKPNFVKGQK